MDPTYSVISGILFIFYIKRDLDLISDMITLSIPNRSNIESDIYSF